MSEHPPAQKTSEPPSSKGASNKNAILLTLGGALALGVPASIHEISDPTQRTVLSLVGIVVVFVLGYYTMPASRK